MYRRRRLPAVRMAPLFLSPRCASSASSPTPPAWIAQLRSDAKQSERAISYDVKIYDELAWRRRRFEFDPSLWDPARMSSIVRRRLCLGREDAEYTVIGEAFAFPDRADSPVVNEPSHTCRLLWDHHSPSDKLLVQLSEHYPPLLWHAVRPTLDALKRIFAEFLDADAEHMRRHLPYYEAAQNAIETSTNERLGETLSPERLRDRFTADMRRRDPKSLEMEHPHELHRFLGTAPHFRLVEDAMMKSNPFVFGWPLLLLSDGNAHLDGTPLRMAAFRTLHSKSLLLLHTRLDLQVDHRLTRLGKGEATGEGEKDMNMDVADDEALLEVPVFCTVNYPTNARLCGGRPLVQRYNDVMGTSFPLDTPVDVLAALAKEATNKGATELLAELRFLAAAAERAPDAERVFRLSEDQLSANRVVGQLAYTVVYLALVSYERFVEDVFDVFRAHRSDLVRVACAKGALIVGRADLVEQLVTVEPEGRCRRMLLATLRSEAKDPQQQNEV